VCAPIRRAAKSGWMASCYQLSVECTAGCPGHDADIAGGSSRANIGNEPTLLDQLIGTKKQRLVNFQADRVGRFEIDDEIVFPGLLHG
jgi:hypothetical protein